VDGHFGVDCTLYSRCNTGFRRTHDGKVLKSLPTELELRDYADPLARVPMQFMAGVRAHAVSVENPATGKLVEREVSLMRQTNFGVLSEFL
jgi:hypothetical protein